MPWTHLDAKRHKKGLTPTQAKRWASIANSVLKRDKDEGKAIRIANAKCCESEDFSSYQLGIKYTDGAIQLSKVYPSKDAALFAKAKFEKDSDVLGVAGPFPAHSIKPRRDPVEEAIDQLIEGPPEYVYTLSAALRRLNNGQKMVLIFQPGSGRLLRATKANWEQIKKEFTRFV